MPGLFRRLLELTLLLVGPLFLAHAASAADIASGRDHALFPRFAGSEIIAYKASDYDEFTLGLGKAYEKSSSHYVLKKSQKVEGKVTRILYLIPSGKTTLQVYRNYEKTLKSADFLPMFSCSGNKECGWRAWFTGAQTLGGLRDYAMQLGNDYRYLASHLERKEGDVYVSLLVYKYDSSAIRKWEGRTMAELNVIELEPMKQEMVRVKAEDLAKNIMRDGHAAVRQIYFDTDKAEIKPESKAALDEIAKLLKGNPGLKVMFVGHTDNQGGLPYNMDLSHRRAQAVRDAITGHYAIAKDRLGAAGVGFLAPVASNKSEAGRAQNRRVELIEW